MQASQSVAVGAYATLTACATLALVLTLRRHPLHDAMRAKRWEDKEWLRAWLKMTVLDYYGAALALSAVAVRQEGWDLGIAWSVGFLLLGAPVCGAYTVYWLARG